MFFMATAPWEIALRTVLVYGVVLIGLRLAGTLVGANYAVSRVRDRVPWLRRAIEGQPTLLIHNGVLLDQNLEREHVDREEVLMALCEHGIDELTEVRFCALHLT